MKIRETGLKESFRILSVPFLPIVTTFLSPNILRRLSIFIFFLVYIDCFGQQFSKSWIDLNYAGDTLDYHRLDIYLPEVEKPKYPVVISIYGSAWFGNNLKGTDLATLGKALLETGFAVVTPNHRSSMDAKFPAQIHDIKAVVRFIRAKAGEYQFDTSFIGITGSSSGGHLAALAGTSGLVRQYTVGSTTIDLEGDIGQFTTYSSSVDAVVDWFGPTDFLVMDSCESDLVHDAADSPESSLVGGPIQENKEKCALANPITYIDANDPPFLILHGDADPLVPYCQSELLFNALQKQKVQGQFILVPDAQHGPGMFVDQYLKMMADFFITESEITGIDSGDRTIPPKFLFPGNYPNPFNTSTLIRFYLPSPEHVTVKVFNIAGQAIENLVQGVIPAGQHELHWSGENLASGVYICSLQAGKFHRE
jgi:acetyl esterase/lipase